MNLLFYRSLSTEMVKARIITQNCAEEAAGKGRAAQSFLEANLAELYSPIRLLEPS